MNRKPFILTTAVAALALWVFTGTSTAQDDELPPIDEPQFSDTPPAQPAAENPPVLDLGPEPDMGSISDGIIATAVIDGIQVSTEPGDKPDEKLVTCYFIFRDKPSSYFYEVRKKEKKIIFEFNDTKKSESPLTQTLEAPLSSFTVDQRNIDINKEIKGLTPEFHHQVKVTFSVDKVPVIKVSDEFNIISFSYKWSSDPNNVKMYEDADGSKKPLIFAGIGVGGAAITVGVLYVLGIIGPPEGGPEGDIAIDDLPKRPNNP